MKKYRVLIIALFLMILLFLIINTFEVLNDPTPIRKIGFVFFTMLWIYGIYQNRKSLMKVSAMVFFYILLIVWGNII
ncbi:hypothetical protein CN692_04835 [Bacillus sp. AFS002410]|uniref:hypothetical protein n=1 Tax=Bacillus sp. AFS002410 TaxID=2033481 RepID=UPI000BF0E2CB|nr:hypothetical protein [Bacillus sp. AFS002410]PEJ59521.1 hypothetical protein CN692_04835 [Bacillus sp. AFS002410]